MARIRLELPDHFPFACVIPVRITDINYGGHLGNDAFLALIHEARVQFLAHHGYTELDIEGKSIIMADAAIVYRSEAHYGERLRIEVGVREFTAVGTDLVYRLSDEATGREVARAKTGIVFFDYTERKPIPVPSKFRARVEPGTSGDV